MVIVGLWAWVRGCIGLVLALVTRNTVEVAVGFDWLGVGQKSLKNLVLFV